jgi:hypothetical protein
MVEVGSNWTGLFRPATLPDLPVFLKLPKGTVSAYHPEDQNGSL